MIEIDGLTKRYGDKIAVDGLSFVVEPGVVTGFLGPNGAGKSTTMRMIAGLDRPTSGTVRVNGKYFPQAPAPMAELGILLDARSVHPGLSATWLTGLAGVRAKACDMIQRAMACAAATILICAVAAALVQLAAELLSFPAPIAVTAMTLMAAALLNSLRHHLRTSARHRSGRGTRIACSDKPASI
jgi:ABC-type cobalamin/Fe3+-siderophores transport system ATPase subunit